jgi:hypothetical protein
LVLEIGKLWIFGDFSPVHYLFYPGLCCGQSDALKFEMFVGKSRRNLYLFGVLDPGVTGISFIGRDTICS